MLINNCSAPGGGFEGESQPQLRKLRYPPPSGQGVISGHYHITQKVFIFNGWKKDFSMIVFNDAYDVMVKVVYNITFSFHSWRQRFHLFHIMWVGIPQWVILPAAAPPVFDIIILLLLFSNEISLWQSPFGHKSWSIPGKIFISDSQTRPQCLAWYLRYLDFEKATYYTLYYVFFN